MSKSAKYLELIKTLENDCKEIEDMVKLRIETIHLSDEGLREALLEDPFTLELSLEDTELDQMHSYDVGRYEAFKEIIRELKRITYDK
jgi:hypothetical protein